MLAWLRVNKVLCAGCRRRAHPVEMILVAPSDWLCLRCIEDARVRKPGAAVRPRGAP